MKHQIPLSERAPGPAWWLSVTFGTLWAGLLAHEGAHFGTLWGVRLVGVRSPMGSAIVPAAGPLITLAIIAMCAVLVSRSHRPVVQRTAFVAAAAAASRIVLIAVPTMQGKSNDEHAIMLATGWSAQIIWTAEAALTTLLLVWIIRRNVGSLLPSEIGLTLLGIFAGWMSAFTFGRAIGLPI